MQLFQCKPRKRHMSLPATGLDAFVRAMHVPARAPAFHALVPVRVEVSAEQ
jgi:hypothetical protein